MLYLLALLIPAAALAILQEPQAPTPQKVEMPQDANDPVGKLQQRLARGEVKLSYDPDRGYLSSLLKELGVSVASQMLVFSKSSFQLHLISPDAPRAMYFNDDVYIGYVQGGSVIEIASIDPKEGPIFYTVDQDDGSQVRFDRPTEECMACHDAAGSAANGPGSGIPRLIVLSILPDTNGNAINAQSVLTTDRSPWKERFGGWYVTGTHGSQRHLGNMVTRAPALRIPNVMQYAATLDLDAGANITDLTNRFDTKPYLSPHSDIVAIMVHAHQTHVHNMITFGSYKVTSAMQRGGTGAEVPPGEGEEPQTLEEVVNESAEQIVEAMLFSRAAPFTDAVKGTSSFAEEFSRMGPRDQKGRSLRDLDLKNRLLRYPLSYLVYSQQFDTMPDPLKQRVYQRLNDVLSGRDQTEAFRHLSAEDRQAITEILRDTKPEFGKIG